MSRRASNNVSLFPFLAVLVCAMGALILLLLVTTRRIRTDQLAALEAEAAEVESEPLPAPPPLIPILPDEPDEEPEPPAFEPTVIPTEGPLVATNIPCPVTDATRRKDHDTQDKEALRGYDRLLDGKLTNASAKDRELYDRYSRARQENQSLANSDKQLREQKSDVAQATADFEETDKRLNAQLAALRRAVQQKESEPVKAVSKFRVVPFDGLTGTVRRPIMIECVGERFRFIPEGVELTRDQLEDFITTFNPLLSGASALATHWAIKDDKAGAVGDPYILLIVRPSASLGFYAARRMLRRLDVPIGYELLGEQQELDLPIADPEATRICRLAIERTLARRDQMNSLRPLAQSLMNSKSGSSAVGGGSSSNRSRSQTTDERVKSFQRIISGMRTHNGQRPPGFQSSSAFANQPSTLPRNPREPGRINAGSANPMGQARLSGQMVSQSQQRPTASGQSSGFPSNPSANNLQNSTRRSNQPRTGGATPGAARLSSRSPSSGQNGATSGFNTPPRLPPDAGVARTNQQPGQRPSAITDGSTKPAERDAAQASSFPGFQPGRSLGQSPNTPTKPATNQPPNQAIPYRRAVDLFVDQNSVIVAQNRRIGVDQAQVSGPWLGAILTQIEAEVRAWGDAPTGTVWAPEVRFRISPGANRTHTRIKNALSRLGMRTTDETTVTSQQKTAAEVFRQPTANRRTRTGGTNR